MSFFLGEREDARVQKAIKIGMAVRRAKKIHVFKPPPSLLENHQGTMVRRETSKRFEK